MTPSQRRISSSSIELLHQQFICRLSSHHPRQQVLEPRAAWFSKLTSLPANYHPSYVEEPLYWPQLQYDLMRFANKLLFEKYP